tara:strand:- start:1 stop:693 length:693 start_codon:yes stop_codon:yes gene_type:complete
MLAIIPARKNSVGLKKKNIKKFHSKELIRLTLELAKKIKVIDKILVSSDDKKILEISKELEVDFILERPKYLSGPNISAVNVYLHALKHVQKNSDYKPNEFIILQPTSPLRTAKSINESYKLYKSKKALSVISCVKSRYPEEWKFELSKREKIIKRNFSSLQINRQNFEKSYYPNGSIYIINTLFFTKYKTYYSNKSYGYRMNKIESIDIDDIYDFKLAEAAFCLKKLKI